MHIKAPLSPYAPRPHRRHGRGSMLRRSRVGVILPLFAFLLAATKNLAPAEFMWKGKPMLPISGAAVGYTYRGSTTSSTDTTSYASSSFTPGAGSTLVVFVVASDTTTDAGGMSDSQSLGWVKVNKTLFNTSTSEVLVFVSQKRTANSSMTVTFDCTGDAATGCAIMVYEITGITRSGWSAVRQFNSAANQAGGGTPDVGLYTVVSSNIVLGCVGNLSSPAGLTVPGSGAVEDADVGYSTPTTGAEVVSRTGSTTGGLTWGSTSATAFAAVALEIDASAEVVTQSNVYAAGGSSVAFVEATFKANVTTGASLAAFVYWNSSSTTCTVGDTVNGAGSWTQMAAVKRGAGGLSSYSYQAFYYTGSGSGAMTVRATWSSNASDYGIEIAEIPASYSAFDAASTTNPTGVTSPVSASFTPNHANSLLVVGGFFSSSPDGDPNAWSGGFTTNERFGSPGGPMSSKTLGAASAQQMHWGTTSAQDIMTIIGAFYQPAAGAPVDSVGILRIGF